MASESTGRAIAALDRTRPRADQRSRTDERPRGRRRRPAPDWGGDELFDQVPRRRFARGQDELLRGDAGAGAGAGTASLGGAEPPFAPQEPGPARAARVPKGRVRSVEQRLTRSPDRIAAWAFALGLLLILVALATSL